MNTDVEYWADLENYRAGWSYRTEFMSTLIAPNTDVLEFGAGRRLLEPLLPEGCTYTPSDLVSRGPGTFVADLNDPDLEPLPATDLAVFSGVVEYVDDLSRLVAYLHTSAPEVLVSYVSIESKPDVAARSELDWRHHLSASEFAAIFVHAGYQEIERHDIETQIVFRFRRAP